MGRSGVSGVLLAGVRESGVELGLVIGSKAKYVTKEDALAHVAGYCVIKDLCERKLQLGGTDQWMRARARKLLARSNHCLSYKTKFKRRSTGTAPRVGLGQEPPAYLQAGNIIRFGIDGLGVQRQPVGAGKAE